MTKLKRALGLIPARGGSKRLPRKNIRLLGGKPLIAYSIDAAIESGCFDTILLSSDDDEILAVADDYEAVTAHQRPAELAGDTVKVVDLVSHVVAQDGYKGQYDVIGLLLPTCPFKDGLDIQAGFDLLTEDVDTVISVTEYSFPPHFQVSFKDGLNELTLSEALNSGNTRSQDQPKAYHPNGAFYLSWWEAFQQNQSFFRGTVAGVAMSALKSVDIDEERDFQYAQFLIDGGYV